MAGSIKLPRWQKVTLNRFEEIRQHPDFEEDVALIRTLLPTTGQLLHRCLLQISLKYETPRGMYELLKGYIVLNEVNPGLIFPPVILVSEIDGTASIIDEPSATMEAYLEYQEATHSKRVYLDISAEAQKEDLETYIVRYYKLIEEKLKLLDKNRTGASRSKYSLKTHYRVISLYKIKKNDPNSSRKMLDEIQRETGVSLTSIKKIIENYNKQKKYDIKLLLNKIAS